MPPVPCHDGRWFGWSRCDQVHQRDKHWKPHQPQTHKQNSTEPSRWVNRLWDLRGRCCSASCSSFFSSLQVCGVNLRLFKGSGAFFFPIRVKVRTWGCSSEEQHYVYIMLGYSWRGARKNIRASWPSAKNQSCLSPKTLILTEIRDEAWLRVTNVSLVQLIRGNNQVIWWQSVSKCCWKRNLPAGLVCLWMKCTDLLMTGHSSYNMINRTNDRFVWIWSSALSSSLLIMNFLNDWLVFINVWGFLFFSVNIRLFCFLGLFLKN